jgi:hypothetical protein
MAVYVGERLLHDTKNRKLQAVLQTTKVIGDFSFHRNPSAFGKKFGIGTQGGDQSGLFQHGWMQKGRDEADFAHRLAGQSGGGLHQLVHFGVVAGHRATDLAEGHF